MLRRWFVHKKGGVDVRLPRTHRWLLRGALLEFRDRIEHGGDDLERLYPPAYLDHPGLEGEYQKYMREELVSSRLNAIDDLVSTLDATHLDAAQAQSWLQAINTVRVIVGTALGIDHDGWTPAELDITEEDDPRLGYFQLYGVLQSLLYALLRAITPEGARDPDPRKVGLLPPDAAWDDDDDEYDDDWDDEDDEDDEDG